MTRHSPAFDLPSSFSRGLHGLCLRVASPLQPTGISELDALLGGGVPQGAIVELCGSTSSGRTSLAFSMLAQATGRQEACAYVDVSDALDPMSLASAGVDLKRLLWIRCGDSDTTRTKPLPAQSLSKQSSAEATNNSFPSPHNLTQKPKHIRAWQHPRDQIRGIETSLPSLMRNNADRTSPLPGQTIATLPFPESANPPRVVRHVYAPVKFNHFSVLPQEHRTAAHTKKSFASNKPWRRLEQALKVTDLLLHSGGWSFIVFDLGNIPWMDARRIELSTWFRFRRTIENTPSILLLLGEDACAKSCSSLVLYCQRKNDNWTCANSRNKTSGVATLAGFAVEAELVCSRTGLQPADSAHWNTRTLWTDSF